LFDDAVCTARRAGRDAVDAARRRCTGDATTTGGSACTPGCGGEAPDPCAKIVCGHNTNTDTVADTATRNTSREFKT
jgi:hypothetical protein